MHLMYLFLTLCNVKHLMYFLSLCNIVSVLIQCIIITVSIYPNEWNTRVKLHIFNCTGWSMPSAMQNKVFHYPCMSDSGKCYLYKVTVSINGSQLAKIRKNIFSKLYRQKQIFLRATSVEFSFKIFFLTMPTAFCTLSIYKLCLKKRHITLVFIMCLICL